MVEQGYGRVVMTTSAGMFGPADNLSYAVAKGAVVGLTRSLKAVGEGHGIKVNLIAPAAMTRMAGRAGDDAEPPSDDPLAAAMAPDLVAPMVAFLAHEDCPVSGEIYAAGAGRFAGGSSSPRPWATSTPGRSRRSRTSPWNWAAINDESGYWAPGRPHELVGGVHEASARRAPPASAAR